MRASRRSLAVAVLLLIASCGEADDQPAHDAAYAVADGLISWAVDRDDRLEVVVAAPAEVAPGERVPITVWVRNLGTTPLVLDSLDCGAPFDGQLRPGWAYTGPDDSHTVWDGDRDTFDEYYWGTTGEQVQTAPVASIVSIGRLGGECHPAPTIQPGGVERFDAVADLRLGPGRLPDAGWFQVDVTVADVRAVADVQVEVDVWRDDETHALHLALDEPSIEEFVAERPGGGFRAAMVFWQGWWQLEIAPADAAPTGDDVLVVRPTEGSNERTATLEPAEPILRSGDAPVLDAELAQLPPPSKPPERVDTVESGRWYLIEIDGEPWTYSMAPTVTFDARLDPEGVMTGFDGCNTFRLTDGGFDGQVLDRGDLVESSAAECSDTQADVGVPRRSRVTVEDADLVLDRIGDEGPVQLRYRDLDRLPFAGREDLVGAWASPLDGSVIIEFRSDGAAASGDCELWWEADRGRLVVGGWPRPDAFTPCGGGPGLLVDGGSGYRPDPTAVRLDGGDLILEQGPTVRFLADGVQEIEWGLGQPVRLVRAG